MNWNLSLFPSAGVGRAAFPLKQFASPEDVTSLKVGEALLVSNKTLKGRWKNRNAAQAGLRQIANGHGATLFVTFTGRGHALVYRNPA